MYQRTSSFRDCQLGLVTLHGGLSCGFSITWKSWERSGMLLSGRVKFVRNSKQQGGGRVYIRTRAMFWCWLGRDSVTSGFTSSTLTNILFVSIWNQYSTLYTKWHLITHLCFYTSLEVRQRTCIFSPKASTIPRHTGLYSKMTPVLHSHSFPDS